jgi:hypothetical protein
MEENPSAETGSLTPGTSSASNDIQERYRGPSMESALQDTRGLCIQQVQTLAGRHLQLYMA